MSRENVLLMQSLYDGFGPLARGKNKCVWWASFNTKAEAFEAMGRLN